MDAAQSTSVGPRAVEYDVVMATDFRFGGGTTASVAEEAEAQRRAGYRTAAMHLPSPLVRRPRPFADRIRRMIADAGIDLLAGDRPVRTKLLLLRHPSVLCELPALSPQVEADHVVLVTNQVPRDERTYYDVRTVHHNVIAAFGHEPLWAPIGPGVRSAIRAVAEVPMTETDWENIIDLEQWRTDRSGFVADQPVIGRHGRDHWSKWPATAQQILAAYPDDPRYRVQIMGGEQSAKDILGSIPDNWTSYGFNAMPIPQFLAGIDFLVYLHHPGLVEAFGRVVLEGLAAGAVCFAPPSLEPIFGDAVTYGTPDDVRVFVDAVYSDPAEFRCRSARGRELVAQRFSHDTHVRRVAALIGGPSGTAAPNATPERRGGTVICAVDHDPGDLDALLSDWSHPTVPIVLSDRAVERAGALHESIPAVVRQGGAEHRHADLGRRLRHLVTAHQATRVLLLGAGSRQLSLSTGGVEVLRVERRSGADSPESSGELTLVPHRDRVKPATALDRTRGVLRQGVGRARRDAPSWARPIARAGVRAVGRARRGMQAMRGGATDLPVPAVYSHVPSDAPVMLLVIASRDVEAEASLASMLGMAQEASSFRIAVLAPTSWIAPARRLGVALETWVSEQDWPSAYTARRSEYARARIAEVSRQVRAATVISVDRTLEPNRSAASGTLAVLEAVGLVGRS